MILKSLVLTVLFFLALSQSSAQLLYSTYDTPILDSTSSQEVREIFLSGKTSKNETWHRFKRDSSTFLWFKRVTYYYQLKDTFIVSERNISVKGDGSDTTSFEDAYYDKNFRFIRKIVLTPKADKLSLKWYKQIDRDEFGRVIREVTLDANGQVTDEESRIFDDKESSVSNKKYYIVLGERFESMKKEYYNAAGFITRSYISGDPLLNSFDSVVIRRDSENKMLSLIEFKKQSQAERKDYEYDSFGNLMKKVSFKGDSMESVSMYRYDAKSRIVSEFKLDASKDTMYHILYQYDSTRNIATIIKHQYHRGFPDVFVPGDSSYFKTIEKDNVYFTTINTTTYDDNNKVIASFSRSGSSSSGRTRKYNERGDVIEVINLYDDRPTSVFKYSYTYAK